jgi:hypothetical protein
MAVGSILGPGAQKCTFSVIFYTNKFPRNPVAWGPLKKSVEKKLLIQAGFEPAIF